MNLSIRIEPILKLKQSLERANGYGFTFPLEGMYSV
jgi:hypothetical protein